MTIGELIKAHNAELSFGKHWLHCSEVTGNWHIRDGYTKPVIETYETEEEAVKALCDLEG